ncbi:MAG: Rod shape-determining protein MreD, partial [Ferruginibacter sp.]|nr:Rod shape-determining protein MreD [Cytophagales bacterium]
MGTIIGQLFSFLLYAAAQVFFVRNLELWHYAFCYVYVAFLLLLPFETDSVLLLVLGFAAGLVMDVFYDTLGIHAAACVLMTFLRPGVIRLITPRSDLDEGTQLSLKSMGPPWVLSYAVVLVFIHHAFLFFLEAANGSL